MLRAPLTFSRTLATLALLGLLAAIAFLAALASGSIDVSVAEVASALSGRAQDGHAAVVRDLRLPRALTAFAVGALLAISGALMQVMLRNPLADPYVLGISGGAAVGALGALLFEATMAVAPAAFVGALVSTLLVFTLARNDGERTTWAPTHLLLTGVVVAAGWGAMIALLLTLAPATQVKGMVYWLLGDLTGATMPGITFGVLLFVLVAALALARDLNALVRGVDDATAVGVDVARLALMLYALTAIATSAAVTAAGSIGFVGLIVPHALRLWLGNDQRLLVPAAAMAGGTLLVVADTAARTIIAPLELPVGVLTALIGVPAFLWLLRRAR